MCLCATVTLAAAMPIPAAAITAPLAVSEPTPAQSPSVPTGSARQLRQTSSATPDAGPEGWSYGARGLLSFLAQESLNPGFGGSGFAVLALTTDLEIEGEFGFATMATEANGLPAGRLTSLPLRGTVRVQLWRFGGAKPYAGGGAGIYLHRFSLDATAERELAQVGFSASADVDPALGIHAAGGIEWRREGVHVGVDVKYVLGGADTTSTVVDQITQQVFRETSTLDLNGLWIAAGVRFGF